MSSKSELTHDDLIIVVSLDLVRKTPNKNLPISDGVSYKSTKDGPVATFPCGSISVVKGSEPLFEHIKGKRNNYIIIRCPNLEEKLELRYGPAQINDVFDTPGAEYGSRISLKLNGECREDMFNERILVINSNLKRGVIRLNDQKEKFEYGLRGLKQYLNYYAYFEFEDSFGDLLL